MTRRWASSRRLKSGLSGDCGRGQEASLNHWRSLPHHKEHIPQRTRARDGHRSSHSFLQGQSANGPVSIQRTDPHSVPSWIPTPPACEPPFSSPLVHLSRALRYSSTSSSDSRLIAYIPTLSTWHRDVHDPFLLRTRSGVWKAIYIISCYIILFCKMSIFSSLTSFKSSS